MNIPTSATPSPSPPKKPAAPQWKALATSIQLLWVFIWLGLWALSGCPGPPGPGDGGESIPEGGGDIQCTPPSPQAPQITALAYKGQVANQPYVLRFAVSWTDQDKDLRGGSFQFVVDETPLQRLAFPSDGSSLNETSGTIEIPLILDQALVQGKQRVSVKLTIWDIEGNEANQPTFQLEVTP